MNNINKDFMSALQFSEQEAEDLKIKFGDAYPLKSSTPVEGEVTEYTATDGRVLSVSFIKSVIEARVVEIVENVNEQIQRSNYFDKLLAGIVIVGGGSEMKNIDSLFLSVTKVEKVRIGNSIDAHIVKASGITQPTFETTRGLTILSLLMAGKESCTSAADSEPKVIQPSPDLIAQMEEEEKKKRMREQAEQQAKEDAKMAISFDAVKQRVRQELNVVEKAIADVRKFGGDKKVREDAVKVSERSLNVITEDFQKALDILSSKDKYRADAAEGKALADKLRTANDELVQAINKAKEDGKLINRFTRWLNEIVNDD
jgi:cell division protein FtsA